ERRLGASRESQPRVPPIIRTPGSLRCSPLTTRFPAPICSAKACALSRREPRPRRCTSLRRLGFDVPNDTPYLPEHRLYALLAAEDSNSAHSRYNALIRRLVSFERAAECLSPNA